MPFPDVRPRRLRSSAPMRRLVSGVRLDPADLVLPLFTVEGLSEPRQIASMPGVVQHSRDSLRKAAAEAVAAGVGGVMLFGAPLDRDATGSAADDPGGVLNTAIRDVVTEVGSDAVVMADLCLDEFTDHGHCGVLGADGSVDNDATLLRYASIAQAQAESGVHVVGASGMMDGQVGAIRRALDQSGCHNVAILAYAAKYASAFYGPFRDAVDSHLTGNRRSYQQDPGDRGGALREVRLDLEEGADVVMVKPAMGYLDVVRDLANTVDVPVAAYQVSGEYAMIEAASERGWIHRESAVLESLTSIRRAGASIVLTYWASEAALWLRDGSAERLRGHR